MHQSIILLKTSPPLSTALMHSLAPGTLPPCRLPVKPLIAIAMTIVQLSSECGVFVVSQPTKDVKKADGKIRVPTLYDGSGSSHWYNAADHGNYR